MKVFLRTFDNIVYTIGRKAESHIQRYPPKSLTIIQDCPIYYNIFDHGTLTIWDDPVVGYWIEYYPKDRESGIRKFRIGFLFEEDRITKEMYASYKFLYEKFLASLPDNPGWYKQYIKYESGYLPFVNKDNPYLVKECQEL